MPHITINGSALSYERDGSGEPVVLVHGSWSGAAVWSAVAAALRERYDVTAYDRLGHNTSDRPVTAYTRRRHEDDLIELVERLGAGPVHLVGSSYGGAISLSVAARRPDLVRSVAVHEPAAGGVVSSGAVAAAMASIGCSGQRIEDGDVYGGTRQFFEDVALGPGGWDLLPEAFRSMALHNAVTFAAEMHDRDWTAMDLDALAAYPGRILITQGDMSPVWFGDIADALARALPHAGRATIEGAGHGPHSTHPEVYAELLADFLGAKVALPG